MTPSCTNVGAVSLLIPVADVSIRALLKDEDYGRLWRGRHKMDLLHVHNASVTQAQWSVERHNLTLILIIDAVNDP